MRERHSKATLDHSSNCIEVSVPTPPRPSKSNPFTLRKATSTATSKTLKGVSKIRLFGSRRSRSNTSADDSKSPRDVIHVVVNKAQKKHSPSPSPSLQISIPTSDSDSDIMPTIIPISSTQSPSESPASAEGTDVPEHEHAKKPTAFVRSNNSMDDPPGETYFLQTDFSRNTWMETMASQSTDSLSFGFISIMAATVVIHPILFVTGAATAVWAVGVVHAVEKGYEFFGDGQFKNMFWADSEVEQFEDQGSVVQNSSNDGNSPSTGNLDVISPSGSFTPPPIKTSNPPMRPPPSPMISPSALRLFRRHVTPMDAAITENFPRLENEVVTAEFPGLNALEFFNVFLSDDAPYSFNEFQQTRGDVDIEFGKWSKYDAAAVSFHPNANALLSLPTCSKKERVMTFKTLTKSYFGPAYANAKKTQRVFKFSTRLVIVESKTELFDIPYCDRFVVVEKWIIESVKHDKKTSSFMPYTTKLSVSVEVLMLKACSWEGQIRQKTLSTMTDFVTSWSEKATQALDLTLKRKLERMRVLNDTSDNKSLYSYRSKGSARISKNVQAIPIPKSQANRLPALPGKSRQTLMDIHSKRLKLLDEKAASGDLEWCSIEMKHCAKAGEGKAFTEVLDDTGMLATDLENDLNRMDFNDENTSSNDCPREISITTKTSKTKTRGIKKLLFLRKK
jgi:hypothetical protein